MQRRTVLQSLLGLPALLLVPLGLRGTARAVETKGTLLQESPVVGVQYHATEQALGALRPGMRLRLVREPTNPHDPRAVAVHGPNQYGDQQLGYLRQKENLAVSTLLDQGVPLDVRVARVTESEVPSERLRVAVLLA